MHRRINPRPTFRADGAPSRLFATLTLATAVALALACDGQDAAPPDTCASAADTAAGANAAASGPADSEKTAAAAASAESGPTAILDCVPKDNARPICKFVSPEDMVPLPGNEAILISGYGSARKPGGLVLFPLADETPRTLYAGGSDADKAEAGWGDPACTSPPKDKFNAHGIDLVRRSDGRLALLVVQHFGREAIEFFEVTGSGTDWNVAWKGCVLAPPDASLNEVVGLPNGDFYTTKMASISGASDFTQAIPTEPTGYAFAWTAKDGYRKIEGTDGVMPNGIAASPDGKTLYLDVTMQSEVRKIDVATGKLLGSASVKMPDNVTWAPDGKRLLVASLHGFETTSFGVCVDVQAGACPIPFAIQAVDAETMTALGPVYESTGAPMGGGTVGLQVGDELFIGSFTGDRILRVALAKP